MYLSLAYLHTLYTFLSVSITRLIVIINFRSEDTYVSLRVSFNNLAFIEPEKFHEILRSARENSSFLDVK